MYELLLELGTGGMGKVYLARSQGMGGFERFFAIKQYHPHLRDDPAFVSMFLDEARIAAQIHHPNVTATIEVGDAGAPYIVMEYVEGLPLGVLIEQHVELEQAIPESIALRIGVDLLSGIDAAHNMTKVDGTPLNIVHRDISPNNLVVGADGSSRILDFGIATAALRMSTTREGQLKGKFGYMAPEQLAGEEASFLSDTYSAGVTLWETLAGQRLYDGASEADVASAVLRGEHPPLDSVRSDLNPELAAIIDRAIANDPGERPQTAAELRRLIESSGARIATTAEVSEWMKSVAGDELQQRRALVAERMKEKPLAVIDPSHTAPNVKQATGADADPDAMRTSSGNGRKLRSVTLMIALLAAVGAVAFAWQVFSKSESPPSAIPTASESVRDGTTAGSAAKPEPVQVNPTAQESSTEDPNAEQPQESETASEEAAQPKPRKSRRKKRRRRPTTSASKGKPAKWWPSDP